MAARFYREQALVVMASLPCYEQSNVDKQRGDKAFTRSIEVLRRLNRQGYGGGLELHLIHNPSNGSVSGPRVMLELHYRSELLRRFGVSFNRLHCMNNTPLGRFRDHLERQGTYHRYIEHLRGKFNSQTTERIMCRTLVSVGWNGVLYNCDFNLAAGLPLKRGDGSLVTIDNIDEVGAPGSAIWMAEHCFSCTAGEGSGCGGTLGTSVNKVTEIANRQPQGTNMCDQQ